MLPFYHLPIKKWTFKIKLHFDIFILCAVQRGTCVEVRGWLSGVPSFLNVGSGGQSTGLVVRLGSR